MPSIKAFILFTFPFFLFSSRKENATLVEESTEGNFQNSTRYVRTIEDCQITHPELNACYSYIESNEGKADILDGGDIVYRYNYNRSGDTINITKTGDGAIAYRFLQANSNLIVHLKDHTPWVRTWN